MRRSEVPEGRRHDGVLDVDSGCKVLYCLREVFYFSITHRGEQNLSQPEFQFQVESFRQAICPASLI